ncbi:hypothetical protein VIGAN_01200600, partial [Vigna angularis var. angularis]
KAPVLVQNYQEGSSCQFSCFQILACTFVQHLPSEEAHAICHQSNLFFRWKTAKYMSMVTNTNFHQFIIANGKNCIFQTGR